MIEEVDAALNKAKLPVKGWVQSYDKSPPVKYLSYLFHPETDSFQVRAKVNWSRRKRGARISKDVKTEEELVRHMKENPITRRSLSSIVMGSLHDPLYLMGPYLLNLKYLYRQVVDLKLEWDELVPEHIVTKLFSYLKPFLKMESVLFPRRAAYLEAAILEFLLFYDGSDIGLGVSIFVRNIFKDGSEITRLFRNKVKLVPSDANTTPRSELLACLICLRMYTLLKTDLEAFLNRFEGTVRFKVFSDSQIVLHQLLKDAFNFKLWVSVRVGEIQQLSRNMEPEVQFFHIPSSMNRADVLTRPYIEEPQQLPYLGDCQLDISSAVLFSKDTQNIKIQKLPELNKKQVHVEGYEVKANSAHMTRAGALTHSSGTVDLNYMLYYNQMKTSLIHHSDGQENISPLISRLMAEKSRYFVIKNIVAKVLIFCKQASNINQAQEKAENIIFKQYQESVASYIKSFRGSKYYTSIIKGVTYVTGRKIQGRAQMMKLVPPKTDLYRRITETFHRKYHCFGPNYIRAQLQINGFYVPSAMKRLKKLQDNCAFCKRRKKQAELYTEMGSVGKNRLTPQGAFLTLTSDICGPFKCVGYIDKRKTMKVWILVNICNFTRYISLHLLENMTSNCLLQAFRKQFLRFGKSTVISADYGSNYSGAREGFEHFLEDEENKTVTLSLQSEGTKLVQRCPKSPWVQSSAERAVSLVKKALSVKQSMSFFQWDIALEEGMQILNNRPLGVFSDMEILTPNSLNPVHSGKVVNDSLEQYCGVITEFKKQFEKNWFSMYYQTILHQSKWTSTSHNLKKSDIVMVVDLFTPQGYPVIARISKVEKDSAGINRFYVLEYRKMKIDPSIRRIDERISFSDRFMHIKRPANSLVVLLSSDQSNETSLGQAVPEEGAGELSAAGENISYQPAGSDSAGESITYQPVDSDNTKALRTFPDITESMSDIVTSRKRDKLKVKYQSARENISDI